MNLNTQYQFVCENVYLFHFFKMVVECTLADGGDGNSNVISEDYIFLADEFDIWRKEDKVINNYKRVDGDKFIYFTDDSNETISFCDEEFIKLNEDNSSYNFRIEKQR